ncbi:ankyrin repeat domain-containing protein [Alphaproteobacteria bacterium]|nr:ankyrin repeat domain-containing protein [Alphaproteobacteria bacterium]
MKKKNIKKFSAFIYIFLFFQNALALDDSDIFLEAVFFTAVKKSNYEKVIEMVEKGVTTNIQDGENMTPLAYALRNDDEKMFELLLKNNADVNKQILKKTSLLTFYIKSKKSKLLKRLLDADADVNFQDSIGMTPMMHAIENINIDAIKMLVRIDYKDELDTEISDYSGKTMFDYVENTRNNYLKKLIDDIRNTF